ncbi:hypothetical protein B0H14DRAFT_2649948 [Mycena olivaceomarginata]|nr:hypothetical protein B0H14DRAFT_2649948 [Mycena olivaceomarginata]
MFTGTGVQNRSDRVTYLGNVPFVKQLPQTLKDHPCCPAIPMGLEKAIKEILIFLITPILHSLMDADNTFKKSDWIDKGRKWADTPPALKKIAAQWFLIPQELEHDTLPSPFLPITKLLEFPLPLESTCLPILAKKTVDKLLANSCQCWLDGVQFVVYSHLGGAVTHFPLWVLTYWSAVHNIKCDAWVPWRNCQAWVNHQKKVGRKNPGHAALAEETSMMLAMVPWGRCKPAGLSDSKPFHTLWCFVGAHWLSGSQMDNTLELLRYKVNTIPESMQNTCIWGTALIPKILEVYQAADAGTYWIAPDLRWIRDLAKDVVQSRTALITSGHLGLITDEPHWVAVIFDMMQPEGMVRYGDSFRNEIPEELAAACRWRLNQHTSEDLELTDLPIARQEDGIPMCPFA